VLDIEARGNDASLVESAIELHNDFARTMIVNDLELSDVTWDDASQHLVCEIRWIIDM